MKSQSDCKVSIIIPFHNEERFIEECIISAEKQTINEKEIICIDDHSDDLSYETVARLSKIYTNIVLVKNESEGVGAARNFGIKIAKGEFISFLDADDTFEDSDALEQMYLSMSNTSMDICGSLRCWMINGVKEPQPLFDSEELIVANNGMKVIFSEYQNDFCFQSYIYRRDFLLEKGILFPRYRRYQDPPFLLSAMSEAQVFWVVPQRLYCYRYGHQNKQVISSKIEDALDGIYDNLIYAKEKGYNKLIDRTIERVETMYYEDVMNNMSPVVMRKTLLINDICQAVENRNLNIVLDSCEFIKRNKEIEKSYRELSDSFVTMDLLNEMKKNKEWKMFFQGDIKSLVIYGLGKYGKLLIDSLENSGIEIKAVIDKKKSEYKDCVVLSPEDELPECDAVVVSVLQYRTMKDPIEIDTKTRILYLMDLVWDYKNREVNA